jgi:three-Cys-motif partner protein
VPTETLPPAHDDGFFYAPDVGPWAEDKHRLLFLYDTLFSTAMKDRWESRVYIDLYSGPGLLRVRETGRFLWGSPLLALQVKHPFDKYIFCESDEIALGALKSRVGRLFPKADITYVLGDCNNKTEEICRAIPEASSGFKVLSFCFVDPYNLSVKFSTISNISERFVDFLTLLALGMDASRNWQQHYLDPANHRVDDFLGLSDWRERLRVQQLDGPVKFPQFLAKAYAEQMMSLGYLELPFHKMKAIRSDTNNLPLYHLALFSRHPLAYTLWDDVLKYSTAQTFLNF